MTDLEDLTLLLLYEAEAQPAWLDRWARSYPTVVSCPINREDDIAAWQQRVARAWADTGNRSVMSVAHGCGVFAWLAWLYQADILSHRRIRASLLVAPPQNAWQDDHAHTLQRARLPSRAALVIGENDPQCPPAWAAKLAHTWQARLFQPPLPGRLDGHLHGWQWGMRLLQEMVI